MAIKNFCFSFFLILFLIFPTKVFADGYVNINTSPKYLKHLNNGYLALEKRKYPLALKEFLSARYIDDQLYASHEGLGKVYEATKNYTLALESYEKAVKLIEPRYVDDYLKQIKFFRNEQRLKDAFSLYKIVLSIKPEAGIKILFGDQKMKQRDFRQAVIQYKDAYEVQENLERYLGYIDVKDSNKQYELFVIRKYFLDGLSYPEAHYKAGLAYSELKQFDKSIEEFKIAIKQTPIKSIQNNYTNQLGLTYYSYGISTANPNIALLDKSIGYFQKVLDNDSTNREILYNLATAYFYKDSAIMNEFDEDLNFAEKQFLKVANLPPNDREYREMRRNLNAVLDKKYDKKFFEKTIDILEGLKDDKYKNSKIYIGLGKAYLKKAIIHHKGYYERYYYLDYNKVNARDSAWKYYNKALEEYYKYLRQNPNYKGFVYYDLGILYYYRSDLIPDETNLPINVYNRKNYQKFGASFYRKDMLNNAIVNLRTYVINNPRGINTQESHYLINQIQRMLSKM